MFKAQPHHYDLVVTDQTMPNMTGDRLAKELLQIRPDIPIILCTGYSGWINERKAKSIGIRGFLLKPLVIRDLSAAIRRQLGENPYPHQQRTASAL